MAQIGIFHARAGEFPALAKARHARQPRRRSFHRKGVQALAPRDVEGMALRMSQVCDMRRLWSEGHDVSEMARVTGHDGKTARKYLRADDFSSEPRRPRGPKLDPYKGWIDRTLEAYMARMSVRFFESGDSPTPSASFRAPRLRLFNVVAFRHTS